MKDNGLRKRLRISEANLSQVNALLLDPDSRVMNAFLEVVARYGTPEEINRKAEEARRLPNLLARLEALHSPYLADLDWLTEHGLSFVAAGRLHREAAAEALPA